MSTKSRISQELLLNHDTPVPNNFAKLSVLDDDNLVRIILSGVHLIESLLELRL